jgi:hypothetical protein
MFDEYEQAYPPSSFYEYEARGGTDYPALPPAASGGAALTREDVEAAEAELASALGTTAALVHEAALEAGGIDPRGNTDFVSLAAHAGALGYLAQTTGITSGYSDPGGDAALKVAEIAERQPMVQFTRRDGTRAARYLIDPHKAGAALRPAPERFPDDLPGPQLTARQEDEIIRLTNTDLRRATYPLVPGRRDKGSVTLARRKAERYLELAADGSTRTYTSNNGSVTVTEYDATEEQGQALADDEIDAAVARYHNQAAQLFGITPMNDNGNRSYAPGPQSAWGQRTAGPWFSGVGG